MAADVGMSGKKVQQQHNALHQHDMDDNWSENGVNRYTRWRETKKHRLFDAHMMRE